jgi:hypothetical protein
MQRDTAGQTAAARKMERTMMGSYEKQKKMHYDIMNVGLRAQATAVGFVQLCVELRHAEVLSEPALERIKDAIADELSVAPPRRIALRDHRSEIKARLDRLFRGEQKIGSADELSFGDTEECCPPDHV